MKKIFYTGLALLAVFEILNVYFIMPMPGSQRMNSIDIAYFLYSYRWFFRILFAAMIGIGSVSAFSIRHKWLPALLALPVIAIIYLFNFRMTADHMFLQPEKLIFKPKGENVLKDSAMVVGVEHQGEVKAYPIRFIVYHHQVQDTVGGMPVIVTYCSVCRTGRVFEPTVKGRHEDFRLVGMDHFNAMFEDATTKSWWRQATGEAITGPLKGEVLPEVESVQVSIGKLFELHPNAVVMQPDDASKSNYDSLGRFERGKSRNELTRTDSLSWKEKSWVVGIEIGSRSKAFDWIHLKGSRVINDKVGDTPIALVLSSDGRSFGAFERLSAAENVTMRNDTIFLQGIAYDFSGRSVNSPDQKLRRIKAYQDFWHSWRTFHPNTDRD